MTFVRVQEVKIRHFFLAFKLGTAPSDGGGGAGRARVRGHSELNIAAAIGLENEW